MADKTETKTPAPKFVAPPKPATPPTGLDRNDYGYTDDKGRFRFWQGYDARYKGQLMEVSRALPQNPTSRKARRILIEAGWSTEEKETAAVEAAKAKAQAVVDRAKAKAQKEKDAAKAKADKAKAPKKPAAKKDEPVVESVPETEPAAETLDDVTEQEVLEQPVA